MGCRVATKHVNCVIARYPRSRFVRQRPGPSVSFIDMPRACKGLDSNPVVPCVFGKTGRPAAPKPGNELCSWCDLALLENVSKNPSGRSRLRQLFCNFTPEVAAKALLRVPNEVKHHFGTEEMEALRKTAEERAAAARAWKEEEARKHVAFCPKPRLRLLRGPARLAPFRRRARRQSDSEKNSDRPGELGLDRHRRVVRTAQQQCRRDGHGPRQTQRG